jgi:tripartite-type tricarboxylate transporter receptor subunit TctC
MNPSHSARRRHFAHWAATLLLACAPAATFAQSGYPVRAITIVVGGAPGSVGDIALRAVGKKLSEQLGQPVVIDNRAGAQGLIAMQDVARAKPDGYTLVSGSASSTVVAPAIRKSWPIDLLKDFTPISLVANSTLLIMAPKESPINSVPDLIGAARAKPGSVTYGNAAALYHLSMELLGLLEKVELRSIPYKSTPLAQNDLMGGLITVLPDSLGSATARLQTGRVKVLAVMSEARSPLVPDAPTMVELGYKDFIFGGTISLLAPAGTPPEIVQRLNAEVRRAVATDEVKKIYATAMLEPVSSTPEELLAMQKRELAVFRKIVDDARIDKQ